MERIVLWFGVLISLVLVPFGGAAQMDFQGAELNTYHGGQIIPEGFSESAVGDIDGDGDIDIIHSGGGYAGSPRSTRVYKNDGEANFTLISSAITGISSGYLKLIDVDLDTDLDLFIFGNVGTAYDAFEIYINDGAGNFSALSLGLPTNLSGKFGDIGDLTGDSYPDILICGMDSTGTRVSHVYANNQSNGFVRDFNFNIQGFSSGRAHIAHLDNGAIHDLIISGENESGVKETRFYNGDGSTVFYNNSYEGYSDNVHINSGDLFGDTNKEVVITGKDTNNVNSTHIYTSNNGSVNDFVKSTISVIGAVNGATAIVDISDLNSSNKKDLVVMGYPGGASVLKLYDFSTDLPSEVTSLNGVFDGIYGGDLEVADFDGNGHLDIFAHGFNSSNDSIADFYFNFLVDDTPIFYKNERPQIEPFFDGIIRTLDFDNDGDDDVLSFGWDAAFKPSGGLYENLGGTFKKLKNTGIPLLSEGDVVVGHLNGDSLLDIVVAGVDNETPFCFALTNSGNGTFAVNGTSSLLLNLEYPSMDLGDVNGDGYLDLLAAGIVGGVNKTVLYLGNGAGGFSSPIAFAFNELVDGDCLLADVTRDGLADVIISGFNGNEEPKTYVYESVDGLNYNLIPQDQGSFTDILFTDLYSADMDNDGDLDLVALEDGGFGSRYFVNLGFGEFEFNISFGSNIGNLVLEDFDGDSDVDIIYTGRNSGQLGGVVNNGANNWVGLNYATQINSRFPVNNAGICLLDNNSDGKKDIFISGYSENNGPAYLSSNNAQNFMRVYYNFSVVEDLFSCDVGNQSTSVIYDAYGGPEGEALFGLIGEDQYTNYLLQNSDLGIYSTVLHSNRPTYTLDFTDTLALELEAILADTALSFTGAHSGIELIPEIILSPDLSFDFWFSPASSNNATIFANIDTLENKGLEVFVENQQLKLGLYQGGSYTEVLLNQELPTNKWLHVLVGQKQIDASNFQISSFVNGKAFWDTTFTQGIVLPDEKYYATVSDPLGPYRPPFVGLFSEVSFWGKDPQYLLDNNILAEYLAEDLGFQKTTNPYTEPLLAWWYKYKPNTTLGVRSPLKGDGVLEIDETASEARGPFGSDRNCSAFLGSPISYYRLHPGCIFGQTDSVSIDLIEEGIDNNTGHLIAVDYLNNFKNYRLIDADFNDTLFHSVGPTIGNFVPLYFQDSIQVIAEGFPSDTGLVLNTNTQLSISGSLASLGSAAFSVTSWLRVDQPGLLYTIGVLANPKMEVYMVGDSLKVVYEDGAGNFETIASPYPNDGYYHHLVISVNKGIDISIIIDGEEQNTQVITSSPLNGLDDTIIAEFTQLTGGGNYFGGAPALIALSEFSIYNIALNESQAASLRFKSDLNLHPNIAALYKYDAFVGAEEYSEIGENGYEVSYVLLGNEPFTIEQGPSLSSLTCSEVMSEVHFFEIIPIPIDCSFDSLALYFEPSVDCGTEPSLFSIEGGQERRAYVLEDSTGAAYGRILSNYHPQTEVPIADSLNLRLMGYHADTALMVDGAGGFVSLFSPYWSSPGNAVSMDAWIFLNDKNGSQAYFSNKDSVGKGWSMGVSNGVPMIEFADTGSVNQVFLADTNLVLNQWYHVAYTIQEGGNLICYIDGFEQKRIPFTGTVSFPNTEGRLMNDHEGGSNNQFTGALNYFKVWDTAQPIEAVRNNMYEPVTSSDSNLVYWYQYHFSHQEEDTYTEGSNLAGSFVYFGGAPKGMQGPGISEVCEETLVPFTWYSVQGTPPVANCKEEYFLNVGIGDTAFLSTHLLDSGSYSPCLGTFNFLADTLPILCADNGLVVEMIIQDFFGRKDSCTSVLKVQPFLSDTIAWDSSALAICPGVPLVVPFSGNNGSAVWLRDKLTGTMVLPPSTKTQGEFVLPSIDQDINLELVQTGASSLALDSGAFKLTVPLVFAQANSLQFSTFFVPDYQNQDRQFLAALDAEISFWWDGAKQMVFVEYGSNSDSIFVGSEYAGFFLQFGLVANNLMYSINGQQRQLTYPAGFPSTIFIKMKPGEIAFSGQIDNISMDIDPAKIIPSSCVSEAMIHLDFNLVEDPLFNSGSLSYLPQVLDDNISLFGSGAPDCACEYVYPGTKSVSLFDGGIQNAIEKDSVMLCLGDTVLISTTDSILVHWLPTGDTSSLYSFVPDSSSMITVEILDSNSCFAFDSIFVQVNSLPQVVAMPDTILCQGYPLVFNASGADSYQWSHGFAHGVANNVPDSVVAIVIGTDSLGCSGSDSVVIHAIPAPIIEDLPIVFSCEPLFVVFNAISTDLIEWSNGVSNGDSLFIEETSEFTVVSTNAAGCSVEKTLEVRIEPLSVNAGDNVEVCEGEQLQLSATGSAPFVWEHGIPNGGSFLPTEGWYYVYAGFGSTCEVMDSVFVKTNPLPVVMAGDDQEICEGNTVTVLATGADSYSWNNGVQNGQPFNPGQSGEYIVEGSNQFGCKDLDSLFIRVELTPVVEATVGDASCGAPSGFILLDVITPDPVTVAWNTGATELSIFDLFPDDYSVEIRSPLGCVFNGFYTVEQLGDYNITFEYGSNACEGDSTGYIEAFVDGEQNTQDYTVEWKNQAGNVLSTGSYLLENLKGGAYWFHATQNGCLDKKQASLAGGKFIGVKITPLDTNATGHTISGIGENDGKIRAIITNPFGSYSFQWENGDSSNLIRGNLGPGKYSILVTSAEGCEFGDSIHLFEPIDLGFPDAFSPNGDELNDFFVIKNIDLAPENTLVVYDVDGEEAYFGSPYRNEWGGVMCELNWPDGQYSYVFTTNGKTYQGVVLLVREE